MCAVPLRGLSVDVVEVNPHAPRPFVFTELAASLQDSLCLAGAQAGLRFNDVDPAALSVVLVPTPGWEALLPRLDPRRSVLFNFEQLGSGSPFAAQGYVERLRPWVVADYNAANVDFLRQANGAGQRVFEVPVVPGPSLVYRPELAAEKSVDVLFFGTLSARRSLIIDRLRAAGMVVETVSGAYAWELTPAILRARLVLHVHYYDTRLFPVARMLQPVVNGVPVVCETSVCSPAGDWTHSGLVFAEHEDLVDACIALLHSPQRQLDSVQRSLRFVRQIDFAGPFQALLDALADCTRSPPVPCAAARQPAAVDAEIDAVLQREATELPPESHLPAPPIALAARQPGQGRFGRLGVLVLLVFVLLSMWQAWR
jgi:hypothetical protein